VHQTASQLPPSTKVQAPFNLTPTPPLPRKNHHSEASCYSLLSQPLLDDLHLLSACGFWEYSRVVVQLQLRPEKQTIWKTASIKDERTAGLVSYSILFYSFTSPQIMVVHSKDNLRASKCFSCQGGQHQPSHDRGPFDPRCSACVDDDRKHSVNSAGFPPPTSANAISPTLNEKPMRSQKHSSETPPASDAKMPRTDQVTPAHPQSGGVDLPPSLRSSMGEPGGVMARPFCFVIRTMSQTPDISSSMSKSPPSSYLATVVGRLGGA